METDIGRWERTAREAPPWDERNRLMAAFVPENASVLDIGAGHMTLRRYLPHGCTYQPVDCVPSAGNTILAEFNAGRIPVLERSYDVAVCSGVLEYMKDPAAFLRIVGGWAGRVLLSYAILEYQPVVARRRANGWFNDFTRAELEGLFAAVGLESRRLAEWCGQTIYELTRRP